MSFRAMMAAIALCAAASSAHAENCRQYPQGPFRSECASRNHPERLAKKERCQEEARQMGLSGGRGAQGNAGGMRGYVMACMQRR
jgi:hypothetical protein